MSVSKNTVKYKDFIGFYRFSIGKLLASNDPHPAKNISFDYGFNILFNYFVVISVYVYICIYVYICVYICTCTHMYMYKLGLAWLRAQPRK